jgi:hypothetical protein
MAGVIEVRTSGQRFRFVVVNRSGNKILQSGQFDDKASAKRAATSLLKAVSGAEIVDATKVVVSAPKVKSGAKAAVRRSASKR